MNDHVLASDIEADLDELIGRGRDFVRAMATLHLVYLARITDALMLVSNRLADIDRQLVAHRDY